MKKERLERLSETLANAAYTLSGRSPACFRASVEIRPKFENYNESNYSRSTLTPLRCFTFRRFHTLIPCEHHHILLQFQKLIFFYPEISEEPRRRHLDLTTLTLFLLNKGIHLSFYDIFSPRFDTFFQSGDPF